MLIDGLVLVDFCFWFLFLLFWRKTCRLPSKLRLSAGHARTPKIGLLRVAASPPMSVPRAPAGHMLAANGDRRGPYQPRDYWWYRTMEQGHEQGLALLEDVH